VVDRYKHNPTSHTAIRRNDDEQEKPADSMRQFTPLLFIFIEVGAPDCKFRLGRFWVLALVYDKHFVNFIS